ncbi:MAG: hypothetical protein U9R11_05780 [Chloroflexota bacterium]|nr:hypothetical protein [Chloroflexota bacterium]
MECEVSAFAATAELSHSTGMSWLCRRGFPAKSKGTLKQPDVEDALRPIPLKAGTESRHYATDEVANFSVKCVAAGGSARLQADTAVGHYVSRFP